MRSSAARASALPSWPSASSKRCCSRTGSRLRKAAGRRCGNSLAALRIAAMRRGEAGMAAIAVAFALFAIAAPAAMAQEAKFAVTYNGNGDFTSETTGHITNNNGRCKDTNTEDTRFSFVGVVVFKVTFSDKGMTGDSQLLASRANDWQAIHNNPSELTKVSARPGCDPPDGSNVSGAYDCTGWALRQGLGGVSKFTLASARRGGEWRVGGRGPAEFSGSGFSGSWVYDTG